MKKIKMNFEKNDYRTDESYKTLRTNIEFSGVDTKVIAVTSCTPEEGKSTVTIELARSLAESGKRVLFIDADLRRSVLCGRYEIGHDVKGLSHFLSGKSLANEITYQTELEQLVMIFSGVIPPNPAELLGQSRFAGLVSSARKVYDYIIIDTPPLGSVIDAAIVAKVCDAAVLVIEANVISYKYARTVKAQLEKSGCPILGAVLNKVDMKQNKYYGKYYEKYYGKYYGKE